jgi:hypothetical protein
LPQNNLSAAVLTNNVERVLTDIDADNGNPGVDLLRHDVLLVFGAPCQLQSLAGQEHGRTIPLPDMNRTWHLKFYVGTGCSATRREPDCARPITGDEMPEPE